MAIDMNRVLQAAAEAMLEGRAGSSAQNASGGGKKRGLTMPRAFLIGAGAVTAGRLVAGSRGRDMLENVQQRLVEYEHRHFDGDEEEPAGDFDEEEPEAEEDEDFDEKEPEAEEDEDLDEEEPSDDLDEEEPEAEEDDDLDEEEPEAEEKRPRRRTRSGSGNRR